MYLKLREYNIVVNISFERERFKNDFKPFPFARFFSLPVGRQAYPKFNTFFKNQHTQHPMSSQCFFAA